MEHFNHIPLAAVNTHPLHIAIEAEDIEDAVCVHLLGVQAVQHDHRRLGMASILSGRRGRGPITRSIASATTSSHWWTHAATFVSIALIVSMVTAALRHKWRGNTPLARPRHIRSTDFNVQSDREG